MSTKNQVRRNESRPQTATGGAKKRGSVNHNTRNNPMTKQFSTTQFYPNQKPQIYQPQLGYDATTHYTSNSTLPMGIN